MIPYFKKIQAAVRAMFLNFPIAKAPTKISSLETPEIIRLQKVNGNIKDVEVGYRISAINEYGETIASEEKSIVLGTVLDTVDITKSDFCPGILPQGEYYYGITAFNDNGETNIIQSFPVRNSGVPAPIWANNPAQVSNTGLLPKGTNFYAVSTVYNNKETDLSTLQEVIVEKDKSSVTLQFLAVEGAAAYKIYGRDKGELKLLTTVEAGVYIDDPNNRQVISWVDNGNLIPSSDAPTINQTTAGVKLQWKAVDGDVKGYRIYGRTSKSPNDLQFIAEVKANVLSYKDEGINNPSYTPPKINESGSNTGCGVIIQWNKVPNSTGYKIYGRGKSIEKDNGSIIEEKGYLVTISDGATTSWNDAGVIDPDYNTSYPAADTTDGTRGVLGCVIPDGDTLEIDARGVLQVKGGIDSFLGRSEISNVKDQHVLVFNGEKQKWNNFDLTSLIFTLISVTDSTVIPKDKKFEEYKNDLVNTLNTINTFKDDYVALQQKVTYLEKCIETIKRDIGTSYFPDKQETTE